MTESAENVFAAMRRTASQPRNHAETRLTARVCAARRSAYTGEPPTHAVAAVGYRRTNQLDNCSAAQRRFRMLLALVVFNDGIGPTSIDQGLTARWRFARWGLNWTAVESVAISPLRDELVIFTENPLALARALAARPARVNPQGVPGLRPLNAHPKGQWFRFVHLPTKALLRVRLAETQLPPLDGLGPWNGAEGLTTAERETIGALPVVSPDAEHLLAALTVRLTVDHPGGRWAISSQVVRGPDPGRAGPLWSRLWGEGTTWELRGRSLMAAVALASALTDPDIGLSGVGVTEMSESLIVLRYRGSTLRIVIPKPGRR
ncbi:hypothetical protein [Allokutzneria sp. NRRL B-24872]|uniref:hypothetical protein n=1 Tax=Allokutzneria sp. NRRL B-24872 TaxID=1137961 RepID=UPI000A39969A|nr:hypothetical protein [Allokutzneria sp. NRRL B-24872]